MSDLKGEARKDWEKKAAKVINDYALFAHLKLPIWELTEIMASILSTASKEARERERERWYAALKKEAVIITHREPEEVAKSIKNAQYSAIQVEREGAARVAEGFNNYWQDKVTPQELPREIAAAIRGRT